MSDNPDAPTPGRSSGRSSPSRTTPRASPDSDTEPEFPPKLKFAELRCVQAKTQPFDSASPHSARETHAELWAGPLHSNDNRHTSI